MPGIFLARAWHVLKMGSRKAPSDKLSNMSSLIKEIDCNTAQEFVETLSPHGSMFGAVKTNLEWIFRGHSDDSYKLLPTALRPDNQMKLLRLGTVHPRFAKQPDRLAVQLEAEMNILASFFTFCDKGGLRIPGNSNEYRKLFFGQLRHDQMMILTGQAVPNMPSWPSPTIYPLVALAQHHNLPTRLLDWTTSSKIAAYFAAEGACKRMEKGNRTKSGLISVWSLNLIAYATALHGNRKGWANSTTPRLETVPRADNKNLHAQSAKFIVFEATTVEPDLTTERIPLDKMPFWGSLANNPRGTAFIHITLPETEAFEVLWRMSREEVDGVKCFPNYSGAAKAVVEQSFLRDFMNPRFAAQRH